MLLATLALLLLPLQSPVAPNDPHAQFDFWIGEWSVQNRALNPDGTWRNTDVTRARITPVCGGRAILEEWAGPFQGAFMNGFSLRAYDPAREDWDLLLYWTTNGRAEFGKLRGTFRHGRGEFFAGAIPNLTRYSFSDAQPNSVRWDSAATQDGGITWKTDWIMEFTRTRAAQENTQDELFDVAWTEGVVTPFPEARSLDWMLGTWEGSQEEIATKVVSEARLRAKLLAKDCLVLDLLETRAVGTEDWDERITVRAYSARDPDWHAYSVTESDTVLRLWKGQIAKPALTFERTDDDGVGWRESLHVIAQDEIRIDLDRKANARSAFEPAFVTRLTRKQAEAVSND